MKTAKKKPTPFPEKLINRFGQRVPKILTPRAAILFLIWEFPTMYRSDEEALGAIFMSGNWFWTGPENQQRLAYDGGFPWRHRDVRKGVGVERITLSWAKHVARYGNQRHTAHHDYSSWSPIGHLPPLEKIDRRWLKALADFLYDIQKIDTRQFELHALSYATKCHGVDNPYTLDYFDRIVSNFHEAREQSDRLCESNPQWHYMTRRKLDDKEHQKAIQKTAIKHVKAALKKAKAKIPAAQKKCAAIEMKYR